MKFEMVKNLDDEKFRRLTDDINAKTPRRKDAEKIENVFSRMA